MKNRISEIEQNFKKDIASTRNMDELFVQYLGKKGLINQLLEELPKLKGEQKKSLGAEINKLKKLIEKEIKDRKEQLTTIKQEAWVDYTIPGKKIRIGHYHPTTLVIRELNNFFRYFGYSIAEGTEIETDEYTFEKLNLPKDHPARDLQDTLYIKTPDLLLRSHTSSVETRVMTENKPPIRIVVPGKCYRNESSNKSNNSIFYQYEGLAVDEGINMTHLKFTLEAMARFLYGDGIKMRVRCKYYPQVEPGMGLDVECSFCNGVGCAVCKYRGWIELLGAGMVHPKALEACGIDPKRYSGFAFGIGLDRIVMTKFNIMDIRYLYNGSLVYR